MFSCEYCKILKAPTLKNMRPLLYIICKNIRSIIAKFEIYQNVCFVVWLVFFLFIYIIVGKGVHTPPFSRSTPPFSKIPSFLEIQDVPTFHRSMGKTEVLNNSCNHFAYNFYPQSILILEECLEKWWDANLI